jgi:multicomponent Na+:H+ antiporter subunit G
MAAFYDIISWIAIVGGGVMCLIGGWGVVRLPDMYTRMHAASIIDTMGVGLILGGLMVQAGLTLITAKLFLILMFIFFTSPTATHALARAALNGGLKPDVKEEGIRLPIDAPFEEPMAITVDIKEADKSKT